MNLNELKSLSRQEIYDHFPDERINADSPIESDNRDFPAGSRAYRWTNEALSQLQEQLHLKLRGRNLLLISCSGDPFANFAYLGAGTQVGFDSSQRAALWSELKLVAIDKLSFNDFRDFTRLDTSSPSTGKYWDKLQPHLSRYAQDVFGELFRREGSLEGIISSGKFFRNSACTGYFPNSNLYLNDPKSFYKTKKRLRQNPPIIIPASLDDTLGLVDCKFGAFYGSNIMDHFKNESGKIDYSNSTVGGFLQKIDSLLNDRAMMILQFEWSDDLEKKAKEHLQKMGYKINTAEHTHHGYGRLTVARKG